MTCRFDLERCEENILGRNLGVRNGSEVDLQYSSIAGTQVYVQITDSKIFSYMDRLIKRY